MTHFSLKTLVICAALCAVFLNCGGEPTESRSSSSPAINKPTPDTRKQLKLYPVDEASKDPTFAEFREALLDAARKRDVAFIRSILAPTILNSFGGDGGVDEFFESWRPTDPNSLLWRELTTILTLGGSFVEAERDQTFCAPYVYSSWERVGQELADEYAFAAIIGESVDLKRDPDSSAERVGVLSYDIVNADYEHSIRAGNSDSEFTWVKVALLDGTTGYVRGDQVRSPTDYRACFEKLQGHWRMTALVAGD